jgi:hypothetical protein
MLPLLGDASSALSFLSSMPAGFTFARGSPSSQFNASAVLATVGNDVPAICFDPATAAPQGLLINQAQTNYVPNPRFEGAVAGSPGTSPTGWTLTTPPNGIARQVIGTGSEDGMPYIDMRFYGTPDTSGLWAVYFHAIGAVPASPGQSWTGAMNVRLVGGSLTNMQFQQRVITRRADTGGVDLITPVFIPQATRLAVNRVSATLASASATTASAQMGIGLSFTAGMPADVTLRIGAPTLAALSIAPPIILPAAGAQGNSTRAVDTLSLTGSAFTQRVNPTQGTIAVDVVMLRAIASNELARVLHLCDGTLNYTIDLYATGTRVNAQVIWGGAGQGSTAGYPSAVGERVRYVLRWQPGSVRHAAMGNIYGAVTTTIPTISQMWIGNRSDAARPLNGYIERVAIYPYAVSDARLQSISVLGASLP